MSWAASTAVFFSFCVIPSSMSKKAFLLLMIMMTMAGNRIIARIRWNRAC